MHLNFMAVALSYASLATATINWSLAKSANPSADELDAYNRIEAAMTASSSRYNRVANNSLNKNIQVSYSPGVSTADANFSGSLRFGSNRSYMNERTALHETSHTLGIGQTQAFFDRCAANNWPTATPLLQSWDGPDAKINCAGEHIYPYGLNYDNEFSELNADRHVLLIQAMVRDGLQG